jgi:hypothetical protein
MLLIQLDCFENSNRCVEEKLAGLTDGESACCAAKLAAIAFVSGCDDCSTQKSCVVASSPNAVSVDFERVPGLKVEDWNLLNK